MHDGVHQSGTIWFVIAFYAIFLVGCVSIMETAEQAEVETKKEQLFPEFAAIIVQESETPSSLAQRYYQDPDMAWLIKEFNDTADIKAGQKLIIPLRPTVRAGVEKDSHQTVTVLSYHKLSEQQVDKMTVSKAAFEAQMNFLKNDGFTVITTDRLFDFLEHRRDLPRKSVLITFDDGWRSTYTMAYPILKEYGYPATLFIYTDLITGSHKTMSWEMVREMAENGIDIQNHTKTHINLTKLEEDNNLKEITTSARIIKEKIGTEVKYLAYPYGETSPAVVAMLKKLGYRGAFSVERGSSPFFEDSFNVKRSMIFGEYDLKKFQKNIIYMRPH